MDLNLRNYLIVTGGYWAFTVTDGAIRMLVVLYFHLLGYSPFEVAMLFLFYEFFGVVTNLVGGWLAARLGLNVTMHLGMLLQVVALGMLTVPDPWLSVIYVMAAQALSGIAKDLNKMSAKASVKTLTREGGDSKLFKWVAILTGSKNALKGAGFFVGAALLEWIGFRAALITLASLLALVLLITWILLPRDLGKAKGKPKFTQVFSNKPAINWLAAARFFLFGARDVWFVVGLPVFLYSALNWSFTQVGAFLALWVIGYGFVQASAPRLLRQSHHGSGPGGDSARLWVFILALLPAAIAIALQSGLEPAPVLIIGLVGFGAVFAINSALHSYLILAYSDHDKVSMNVGFYYMANAGGRLAGTVLSGWAYQSSGLSGCLWWSAAFLVAAWLLSLRLPTNRPA
jgi:predicted MFS family arabinose efflux permease